MGHNLGELERSIRETTGNNKAENQETTPTSSKEEEGGEQTMAGPCAVVADSMMMIMVRSSTGRNVIAASAAILGQAGSNSTVTTRRHYCCCNGNNSTNDGSNGATARTGGAPASGQPRPRLIMGRSGAAFGCYNSLDQKLPDEVLGQREQVKEVADHHSSPVNSSQQLSDSSRKLLEANSDFERQVWRAARDHCQSDHYDYSLFGLNPSLDQAVGRHQREAMLYQQDRHLKEEQAKLVAPNLRQSPIAIMNMNPTYELGNKPLIIEYPSTVENLRLNNTGFSWEVKIPYQISMTTALFGAHLSSSCRFRLDQFHCHWGANDDQGSEHMVDGRSYSAEIHFVHYNMEKYHTMSKAARHPDGLVVLAVFLEARKDQHNHAELEKIVAQLKAVPLKGEHSIIKQAVRIENLLPQNKSFWSYQGSLTTPPYFESVTWFIMKHPIKCSSNQLARFRNLNSSLRPTGGSQIKSNFRKTQPLNGRTIVNYDEPAPGSHYYQ